MTEPSEAKKTVRSVRQPKRFAALSGKELVEIVVAGLGGEVGEQQLKRQVVVAYGTPHASKPRDTAGRLGAAKALAQSG